MAARKSLEGPEDLVGHLAGTKTLDLGSWIYKDNTRINGPRIRAAIDSSLDLDPH